MSIIWEEVEELQSNVTRDGDGQLNGDKKNVLLSLNLISINIFVCTETRRCNECIMTRRRVLQLTWRRKHKAAGISSLFSSNVDNLLNDDVIHDVYESLLLSRSSVCSLSLTDVTQISNNFPGLRWRFQKANVFKVMTAQSWISSWAQ